MRVFIKNILFLGVLTTAQALESSPLALCGGAIESDADSVSYSGALLPGEVCVWTIHLTSQFGFGFNFTQLDVHSQSSDCSDGGIRIYALTNLVAPHETQSYT